MAGGWIIFLYLIGVFLIGTYTGKFVKGYKDYILGGGRFGILLLMGTIVATQWGGGSFLGIAGFGYEQLYRGVWYALATIPRFLIWAFLLAIIIRKVQPYTISEWFALRYDSKNGMLVSIINLIIGIGLLGSQFVAFGNIVATFMNYDLTTSIIIGAIMVGIYTIIGGLIAVAVTDVVQLFIALFAVLGVLGACIARVGTFAQIRMALPEQYFNPANPYGVFFMVTIFMLWMADIPMQYVIQRISSAKTLKVAFWGPVCGALSFVLLGYISPAIGAYAKVLLPNLARPDMAYPALLTEVLNPYLAALAAAGLMAAVMSTGDSYLLAPATLMSNDFFRLIKPNATEKQSLVAARIFTVVYILLGLWAALIFKAILKLSMTFLAIGMAMLPAFIASVCWKKATNAAAFWSMLVGGGLNIYLTALTPAFLKNAGIASFYYGWAGFVVALVLLVVISLVKPETEKVKITTGDLIARVSA